MSTPRLPIALPNPDFPKDVLDRAARIKVACFDVDGVLTDGRLWYGAQGEALKCFHVHDGLGLKMILEAGIEVAVVTARRSDAVVVRMAELGVTRVHQGVTDKRKCVLEIAAATGCDLAEVAFTGDDLPDSAAMGVVGLAISVANARPQIQGIAHWITSAQGGGGAVREVCDLLLLAHPGQADDLGRDGTSA